MGGSRKPAQQPNGGVADSSGVMTYKVGIVRDAAGSQ